MGTSGVTLSPEVLRENERIVEDADGLAIQRCAHIVREADFNENLVRLGEDSNVPILCLHGDCDQGAPFEKSTKIIKEIIPRVQVELYEKAAHGENFHLFYSLLLMTSSNLEFSSQCHARR